MMDMSKVFHECWDNSERMRSLFSEFRSKTLNPLGWHDKMSVWKQVINDWCRQRKRLRFTQDELYSSFEWKGSYPQCLQTVLEEMQSDQSLTTVSEFQSQISNKSWVSWGVNIFVKQPIGWGWSFVRNSVFGPPASSSIEYLNAGVLKEMSAKVLQRLQERDDQTSTLSCKVFQDQCKDICPNFDDFLCIVQRLEFDEKLAVFVQDGQKLIKVKSKKSKTVSLTETDIGVVRLQKARQTVEKEMEKLKAESDRCRQEAVIAVKNGFRNKAEVVLAKKQRLEKQIDKKMATLENIEKMMEQLQESDSHKEVVQAYRSGVAALKSTVRNDLDVDKIDDTMTEIEDTLEMHAEIQATLGRSIRSEEDDELEAELDRLLQEDTTKELDKDLKTLNLNESIEIQFPKVPEDSPNRSQDHVLLRE